MPRTSNLTQAAPASGQMDRPYDPEERARMDRDAPELAMQSDHHALAGSAAGVGSVEYDDPGAYDVGAGEAVEPIPAEPRAIGQTSFDPGDSAEQDQLRAGGVSPGGPDERRRAETGRFDRTEEGRDSDATGPIALQDRPAPPD